VHQIRPRPGQHCALYRDRHPRYSRCMTERRDCARHVRRLHNRFHRRKSA
jgi:hypothetical protein